MTELEKLLARAVELEQKADDGTEVDPDEVAAMAEALEASSEPGVDAEADADAALDDEFGDDYFDVDDPEDHEALDDDEEKGFDFAPEVDLEGAFDAALAAGVEVKAAAGSACPSCGSTARDELVDGRVLCSDCGAELAPATEAKGFDFDDLDAETTFAPVNESKALTVDDDASTRMDELDVLRARRLELDA